jgi:hypothetical protein
MCGLSQKVFGDCTEQICLGRKTFGHAHDVDVTSEQSEREGIGEVDWNISWRDVQRDTSTYAKVPVSKLAVKPS